MRILTRWLLRDTWLMTFALAFALLIISAVALLAQYLDAALIGEMLPRLIPQLIWFSLPGNLALIIPLAFFAAVILVLSRMYAEAEMDVLRSAGVGQWILLRSMLPAILLMTILTAILILFWVPASVNRIDRLFNEHQNSDLLDRLQSRQPLRLNKNRLIYTENADTDASFITLVLVNKNSHQWQVMLAPYAQRHWSETLEGKYLILENASLWSAAWNVDAPLREQYAQHTQWRIPQQRKPNVLSRIEAQPTAELWKSEIFSEQLQLQWRLALVTTIPILGLYALPLARVAPRKGRLSCVIPAMVIFLPYLIALFAVHGALSQGVWPLYPGLWMVHLCALLGIAWLYFSTKVKVSENSDIKEAPSKPLWRTKC